VHHLAGHEIENGDDEHAQAVKIFAYEHITGGGFVGTPLPGSLRAEGELMLRSLVADLAAIADVRVVTTSDYRVDLADLPAERHLVHDRSEWQATLAALLGASDALWPVAPETGGTLENLSLAALAAGRILLNSRPAAVRLAASKLRTAQALAAAGIETIPTFTLKDAPPAADGAWVVKPDDGCGCQDTHFCDDLGAAARWIEAAAGPGRFVLQPYVSGEPASLCALARDGMAWVLSVNRQRIVVRDDCFAFLGTVINGFADDDGRCGRLARDVAQAVPGLWGFFGIDLVLAEHGPVVVEINPRLTTSYVGLGAALDCNPAALVLDLIDGERPFSLPAFRPKKVDVDPAALWSER
jgi:predicted ATP-grasp superfamily ATP-dependent carboligase